MKPRHFLEQLRDDEIATAIQEAERKTSGEIRVFISRKPTKDPVAEAQSHFVSMQMHKTRERNAVLIFVAPESHNFAVIGDTAVHAQCGEAFWQELASEMTAHFRHSRFSTGIIHAVRKAGELLAQHFPRRPDDENELPDRVEHD
ncbi:MAG TPA: TPM domain-containing protein [Candidatus Limnocylindrales bacterium]|nr:TPM domain-containing protein [Candidatus Limnocylindrales bacterium]